MIRKTLMTALGLAVLTFTPLGAQPNEDAAAGDGTQIRATIEQDLEDAERVGSGEISVEVDGPAVRLSGTVNSLLDKRLASRIAKRTRGVEIVLNQIIVTASDRSDQQVRSDVEKVLRINQSVPESRIEVAVENGVVTLSGRLASLAEKRIAMFAASGVRGVTEVQSELVVRRSSDRTDEELREEISALLVQSVYLDDADVRVNVEGHIAKLTGSVPSAAAKDRAERVAEIWGVSAVDTSGLKVDPNLRSGEKRKARYADIDDQQLAQRLDRAFHVDPILFHQQDAIETEVEKGVVTLAGTVDRVRAKHRAAQVAGDVVGVQQVDNRLRVEYPDRDISDMQMIQQTQEALARSAYLDRNEIRVHCQRAHVSLYGVVDSETQKRVAEYLAGGVPGVVHVNNRLVVADPESDKSDQAISEDLERKLRYTLYDDSSDVTFEVHDGVVILRGEVDTWRQWQAAMDLAIEAGARNPHNLINVRYHPPHGAPQTYVPE
ncbi:BON domain-containing protein [Roseimaritima sediminicola]|uniref:BON domain-containing protein n=1 Tax=Roseimaritima sediminicola TaxID=2662066 RepID=UPI0012983BE3|nr:BON domain-containing protein [Roseimaritima sediminicola]